jgi:plastocyanin
MLQHKLKLVIIVASSLLIPSITQAEEITVTQTNKTFMVNGSKVEKLTIKAGDTVSFRNDDPWFHNIFSLSELKTFDLGSYPKGQSKSVTFDKPGKADIECAIHPQMQLTIEVK